MYTGIHIIAEVKTQSPFGFKSDRSWEELFQIAEEVGDTISIHTDARWGGSFEMLKRARLLTHKPILAKGIHATDDEIWKAIELGADHVLVVGRMPGVYADKCLIEPMSLDELRTIPAHCKVVWNTRDLANGETKQETFEEARALFGGWLCQASNITHVRDIKEGTDAVLVGTHLIAFAESVRA